MLKILIGVISGFISGLGMGGGIVLILLLILLLDIEQQTAQAANLIFFIPTSIIAIYLNLKKKNIEVKLALIVSICGIIGAIIGAKIAIKIDVEILRKIFGIFLLLIAIHEVYMIMKKNSKT